MNVEVEEPGPHLGSDKELWLELCSICPHQVNFRFK
jgi:hypothetical protein